MISASNLLHYPFVVAFAQARARYKAERVAKSASSPSLSALDQVLLDPDFREQARKRSRSPDATAKQHAQAEQYLAYSRGKRASAKAAVDASLDAAADRAAAAEAEAAAKEAEVSDKELRVQTEAASKESAKKAAEVCKRC